MIDMPEKQVKELSPAPPAASAKEFTKDESGGCGQHRILQNHERVCAIEEAKKENVLETKLKHKQ